MMSNDLAFWLASELAQRQQSSDNFNEQLVLKPTDNSQFALQSRQTQNQVVSRQESPNPRLTPTILRKIILLRGSAMSPAVSATATEQLLGTMKTATQLNDKTGPLQQHLQLPSGQNPTEAQIKKNH